MLINMRNGLMAGGKPTYSGSAFRIDISQSAIEGGAGSVAVGFSSFSRLSGYASVTIDWGDGSMPTAAISTSNAVHTYTTAGSYVVNIEEGVASFRPNTTTRPLVVEAICWGKTVTSTDSTFRDCSKLTGNIPDWSDSIQVANRTYHNCGGLTGSVPEWGKSITKADNVYYNCTGITGTIPPWGDNITDARSTYSRCTGLTGSIPAWGPKIRYATGTYDGCSGLTGSVPPWGENIIEATTTYQYCHGLTGSIPPWGPAITTVVDTYYQCFGLSGSIPPWGESMTNVTRVYYGCSRLTDVWRENGEVPPVSSLMPSRIISHDRPVVGTAASLRAYFYTTWGGTVTPP